jgi:hypothetical protein
MQPLINKQQFVEESLWKKDRSFRILALLVVIKEDKDMYNYDTVTFLNVSHRGFWNVHI